MKDSHDHRLISKLEIPAGARVTGEILIVSFIHPRTGALTVAVSPVEYDGGPMDVTDFLGIVERTKLDVFYEATRGGR